ncbi:MAG: tetratricopeptide (TPR) repeat protein [Gammaproteobacteria bacterium]|jgi:tetratricopeptide (TPR) repeat protein
MSIINNVLKDLEGKASQFTPIEIASVAPALNAPRKSHFIKLFVVLLLLLIVAATLHFTRWQDWLAIMATQTPAVVTTPPAVAIAAQASSLPVVEAPGNEIIGLQFRESETEMSLEFSLRDKVVAYLRERRENSFVYHLKDIDSQIVAPEMVDNRWIASLSILPKDQGVDIYFQTTTDILVETRQQFVDGNQVWAIKLKSQSIAAELVEVPVKFEADPGKALEKPLPVNAVNVAVVSEKAAPEIEVVEPIIVAPPPKPVKVDIRSVDDNSKGNSQLEYALILIKSNRFADAEALLLSLYETNEELAARQQLLGLYSLKKRKGDFEKLAFESMAVFPQAQVFRTEFVRSLSQRSDYRAVIDLFLVQPPADSRQQSLLASSYQRIDQHDMAIKHFRLALKTAPGNAKTWIGLGISQEHSSALADALNSYNTAIKIGTLNTRLQAFVEKRRTTLEKVLN